jgi:hypothetical protein
MLGTTTITAQVLYLKTVSLHVANKWKRTMLPGGAAPPKQVLILVD